MCCDTWTHFQVTAVQTGDSTRAVAREQLCGHVSLEDLFYMVRVWALQRGLVG
jgi:hypothetical protein